MIDISKNYWLYIAPYVYCCIKNKQALLYNTQSGVSLEIKNYDIILLLQSLHEKKNLGAISCKGETLMKSPYLEFISEFCKKEMGNIVDVSQMPKKPIQMMPVVNLQCDIDDLKKMEDRDTGEDVFQYLLELNIYLNNVCDQDCLYCDKYFRQSLCCQTNDHANTICISTLRNVLSQIRYGTVGKLNLLGGDVFKYPYYNDLSSLLLDFKCQIHIWNHYANYMDNKILNPDFIYNVIVPFPMIEHLWKRCLSSLKDLQVRFHFYITQVEEYEEIEEIIEKYEIEKYSIHPVYIETNHDFFKEYVYTNKEDILQTELSFNQIFAHQKMNTNFFGSLTILANGDVYANVNSLVLGNILNDTLMDVVNKEMITNTAWRKIRDAIPCANCLYQSLCSSPSNYEIIIGKNNLCHVKE